MEFLDARRLTGPNLLTDGPAAILDIACSRDEADRIEPRWRELVARMRGALGWQDACDFCRVDLTGGVSLAFTAAIDALYAATEINEWAWAVIDAETDTGAAPDFDATRDAIAREWADERNPALLALEAQAAARDVPFLWDDDEVSLGLGRSACTWPARELPEPASLDWSSFGRVPIGLVTGTNGKTTTVRLATHILRAADLDVGLSSTDWIAVSDRIIDRGDWSGPGGARAVLREPGVDVAILESARGGLLRRGLGVAQAAASLITNISEDHLGDFGSRSLDELTAIKWIVSHAVRESGRLILNADDSRLVRKAQSYDGDIVWFSLVADNTVVDTHVAGGGSACVLEGDEIVMFEQSARHRICRAADIPITLGGAARHNVANALAAVALTRALGASWAAVRDGLKTMSQDDNPGRCNVYDVRGRKVLIDFAHNPQAMRALFDMARAIPAERRVLCFGQAGDRPDALIRKMTGEAWSIGLDHVIVSELEKYHRGREHGDVYAIIRDELLSLGAADGAIAHYEEELESLAAAFDWSDEGDLIIMLALGGAKPIQEKLAELAG